MKKHTKNRISDKIQLGCVLYLCAWLLAPPLVYGTIYRLLAVLVAVIWIFAQIFMHCEFSCSADHATAKRKFYFVVLSFVYLATLFFYRCYFEHSSLIGSLLDDINTYILLFVAYIGVAYVEEKRQGDLKIIFFFCLILAIVFSLTSILRPPEYFEFTRSAGGESSSEYLATARRAAALGVGGFGFFCFTSVFAPFVLWTAFKFKRWYFYAAFVVVEIGVISAGYTLALIISLVGIVYCFFLNVKSIVPRLFAVLFVIFFLLMGSAIAEEVYLFLRKVFDGSHYQVKIEDIFMFILEGESVGTFADRQERYLRSLSAIFNYPVFGSRLLSGKAVSGYHSSVLDHFAVYGWGIGAIWLYLFVFMPSDLMVYKPKKINHQKILSMLLLFLTALFNQYTMMMGVFCLLFPALSIVLLENSTDVRGESGNENIVDNVCGARKSRRGNRRSFFAKRNVD